MNHSSAEIFAYVLLDVVVIVAVARLFGRLARKLRQPAVVGEIVAGIALGPSLLGALPGDPVGHLFPDFVVPHLQVLAQLGLVLFMFIVGLELDVALLRGREKTAGIISLASIATPFALGALLALYLHPRHASAADGPVPLLGLTLFLGVAMSITAFPVLARILTERRMHRTPVGALALAAAAVDDILAWTLLAFVVAVVKGGKPVEVLVIVGSTAAFAAAMFWIVRPLLHLLPQRYEQAGRLTPDLFAILLIGVLGAAYLTEQIGIHAIFGAFLFGAAMPRHGELTRAVLDQLEQMSVLLLLPLFFVVTGFGVDVRALGAAGATELALIVAVAVAGKFLGAYSGARMSRTPAQHSAAIAVLMNTRGLTELVILAVGLELGVLDDSLFTMLVLMALITTVMTEPLLRIVYPDRRIRRDIEAATKAAFGERSERRALVMITDAPDAVTDRMIRVAAAVIGPGGEVVLSRILDTPEPSPELGAGILPDLVRMAEAVEHLERIADRHRQLRIRPVCRFESDPSAQIPGQLEACGARVLVVPESWEAAGLPDTPAITVLVVPDEDPDVTVRRARTRAALAVAGSPGDGSPILVWHDGTASGRHAALVGAHAAAATGSTLIVGVDGDRARRKLSHLLASVGAGAATVLPLDHPTLAGETAVGASAFVRGDGAADYLRSGPAEDSGGTENSRLSRADSTANNRTRA